MVETKPAVSAAEVQGSHFAATGQPRASISLHLVKDRLVNTDTLCNIAPKLEQAEIERANAIGDRS